MKKTHISVTIIIISMTFSITQSNSAYQLTYNTFTKNQSAEEMLIDSEGISSQNNCDLAYPDFCIPHSPPDLDCKDIRYKNFTVMPPDPHRFDRDHDGIGCEG